MHATEADILLYLENKLSPENTEEMKGHFSHCHQCREQLVAILRLPSVIESPDVHRIEGRVLAQAQQLGASTKRALIRFSFSPFGKLALAAMVFLALRYRKGAPFFLIFAVMVAYSRVYVGAHYPSDIVVGASLGTGIAFFYSWAEKKVPEAYRARMNRSRETS